MSSCEDNLVDDMQVKETTETIKIKEQATLRNQFCGYAFGEGENLHSGLNTFDLEPGVYYHKMDCDNHLFPITKCQVTKISGSGTVLARAVLENDKWFGDSEWLVKYDCQVVSNYVIMGPFGEVPSKWDEIWYEIIVENSDATVSINTHN